MKRAVALSLLAALGLAASLAHAQSGTGKIQIFTSRDTSFITKPLRADGTVDYVAALDAERRHGLKPDENAAIGLIRALAFLESGSEGLAYKLLNMTPPEPGARHFVELEAYVASSSPATQDANQFTRQRGEQLAKAMSAPWTQDQLPLIAGWLSVNEQPLNQVAAATTMPGFYLPLIYSADPPSVADAKPPRVGVLRSAAMALRRGRSCAWAKATRRAPPATCGPSTAWLASWRARARSSVSTWPPATLIPWPAKATA